MLLPEELEISRSCYQHSNELSSGIYYRSAEMKVQSSALTGCQVSPPALREVTCHEDLVVRKNRYHGLLGRAGDDTWHINMSHTNR